MLDKQEKRAFTRFPVISQGAEYLVMGYLMRRNILTYKAPPNNEGYDLICILALG
jgi:Mg2+/Co2+ transporter CorC